MGELFAGPGYRTCSHPGCRWPAVTSLGYDYSTAVAWLEDLDPSPHPAAFELCSVHADRFSPPKGWSMDDRRGNPSAVYGQTEVSEDPPAFDPEVQSDEDQDAVSDRVAFPDL